MCLIMLQLRGAEKAVQNKHFQSCALAETAKMKKILNFKNSDAIFKKEIKRSNISETVRVELSFEKMTEPVTTGITLLSI